MKTVLKQKVEASLARLDILKQQMTEVEFKIKHCSSQENFSKRFVEKSKQKKTNCELIKSFPFVYEEHVYSLKKFVKGDENVELDRKVLGSFLKLMHLTDRDRLEVENLSLFGVHSGLINLRKLTKYMIGDKLSFCVMYDSYSFTLNCFRNELDWPIKIDFRIVILLPVDNEQNTMCYTQEKINQCTRVFCDMQFNDKTTSHTFHFPRYLHNKICDLVFEISVHDKN